jgi:hypothetical protein
MSLTLRAVPTVVCACFYSLLEAGEIERDAVKAWDTWNHTVAREVGEEPEATKLREDLARLGREPFVADWNYLLGVLDAGAPGELLSLLRNIFARQVRDGFERRARRTGYA